MSNFVCAECGKELKFGEDGSCSCGKILCYKCFVEKHREHFTAEVKDG